MSEQAVVVANPSFEPDFEEYLTGRKDFLSTLQGRWLYLQRTSAMTTDLIKYF